MEDKDNEEDNVKDDDDSDYIDDKMEKRIIMMKKVMVSLCQLPVKPAPVMDHDDILMEVMDVVSSDDNVSLHTQPPTKEVRANDVNANADSVFTVDHFNDGTTAVNFDAASNVNDSANASTNAVCPQCCLYW